MMTLEPNQLQDVGVPEHPAERVERRVLDQPGRCLVVSAFGLSAVSTAQASGTSQSSANAISTPTQIRLNSLVRRRRRCARLRAVAAARWARGVAEWPCQTSFSWRRTMANQTAETASTTRKNSIETAAAYPIRKSVKPSS